MSFPSGFPMHLSAHQPQQRLASCEQLKLRCGHESHGQSSSCARRSRQIVVFRGRLPSLAFVCRDLGEVCCIHSDSSRRSLKLRLAMKQIQLSQFDPARLFTFVLSRFVESHAAEGDRSREWMSQAAAVSTSSSRRPEEILRTTLRRWPSRYY